ncbi:MAG: tRNA pseudouridine(55) synthase TruB [Sulfurospirillum sp.]|nr:MAG: tRNA pseudouridine(55) synthase TruB [Sulfurospirillum sp.]
MPKANPDRLFVAHKPAGIGSNRFLGQIKRKYGVKKAGFSGTLDPFASGVLIMAFGKYTKLFRFLKKAPKSYRATLWLGAYSETLDIEKISEVATLPPFHETAIEDALMQLGGEITYLPPKYSAKKIDGKRAYALMRNNEAVTMREVTSFVHEIRLLHYRHPFVTFEVTVSEGTYVRSLGEMIARKLGCDGALSMLERLHEGAFYYEEEKALDPLAYLDMEENFYLADHEDLKLGRKLRVTDFQKQNEAIYLVQYDTHFAIIEIRDGLVKYLLNGVNYADIVKKER